MSEFSDFYIKPLEGYDDTHAYYGKDELEQAFNAGAAKSNEELEYAHIAMQELWAFCKDVVTYKDHLAGYFDADGKVIKELKK